MVLALTNTVFARDSHEAAVAQRRVVADQLRGKFPQLAAVMGDAESDVFGFMSFPEPHGLQIRSTRPLQRLNAEIKLQSPTSWASLPNEAAITGRAGALLERNDGWQAQRRYSPLEALFAIYLRDVGNISETAQFDALGAEWGIPCPRKVWFASTSGSW